MSDVVPRVAWHRGQVLLPEHFRALEDSLAGEAAALRGAAGLPDWGFVAFEWDASVQPKGIIGFKSLRWVTRSGRVVDVPGNAGVPSALTLDRTEGDSAEVFLHLCPQDVDRGAGEPVQRARYRLVLSRSERLSTSLEHVRVGAWEAPVGDTWRRIDGVVPPLLGVADTVFLRPVLSTLAQSIEIAGPVLSLRLLGSDLPPEIRHAIRVMRAAARRLLGTLKDVLEGGVNLHPYVVFSAIREFALVFEELGAHVGERQMPVYRHDQLGGCFPAMAQWVEDLVIAQPRSTSALRFERETIGARVPLLVCRDIPEEALREATLYVLVHRPLQDARWVKEFRFAAPTVISETITKTLDPIPVQTATGSVAGMFGVGVDVYSLHLDPTREDVRRVKRDRAIAIHQADVDERAALFLYWHQAPGARSGRPGP